MAQHDYVIANQSGAAFRSDLNNGLSAIVSQNSGSAEPSTTYAYQWWADTTTGLLKIRNAANSAWVTVGTLATTNLGLAPLASPTFTGTVTAPTFTASTGVNIPLGGSANPSLYFTGDANTGIYSPTADTIGFVEGGSEAMRVDSNGRLLLGTTSSITNRVAGGLQVASTGNTSYITATRYSSSAGNAPGIVLGRSKSGTLLTNVIVANNDTLGNIEFSGANGTAFETAASITAQVDGTPGATVMPGRLIFSTTPDGVGPASPTERFRIGNAGQLGIGGANYGNINQVLTSNGTSLAPTWADVPSPAALSTASGSAPSYSARAWVNFNGTGTVAIRASGNVSSITDNGTGDYTVNFTTAMPDANYSFAGSDNSWGIVQQNLTQTTTACRHVFINGSGVAGDRSVACLNYFR